ncbi:MAG: MBL fold metallo-hydrolase [Spirochaetales bacterium]|nr:MBL fold metallo-hydrolase [Spirochaetales bacterium]
MIKKHTGTCNNYIIEDNGSSILIDCGFRRTKEYESFLDGENVRLIILTHEHIDHCIKVQEIKQKYNIPVLSHTITAEIVKKGIVSVPPGITVIGKLFSKSLSRFTAKVSYPPCTVDITFEQEYDLKEFGINGKVLYTPGHSRGSVSVFVANSIIFIGDMLFNSPLFNIRYKTPPFCEDVKLLTDSIKRITSLDPGEIYPGHGNKIGLPDVRKTLFYIERKYR